jgi:hypothetical protein
MKYLKKRNPFLEDIKTSEEKKTKMLIENVNYHRTRVENLGEYILPDPKHGDFKLNGQRTETVNRITFGLNSEFNFD